MKKLNPKIICIKLSKSTNNTTEAKTIIVKLKDKILLDFK